jgi:UDP-glucose 4-epimerase
MTVLVTGGAGYIGSHTVLSFLEEGIGVVVLDDLSTGSVSLVDKRATFVKGNAGNTRLVKELIIRHKVTAVIHFAGSIVVPESVNNPLAYYDNNVVQSRNIMNACIESDVRHFVFSSTASIYGAARTDRVTEDDVVNPINPYGRSKLMTEWMLEDASKAHDFRYIALRYFNVAGADPRGRSGQINPLATHLIKQCCRVALGKSAVLRIFGTDYPTKDGTGVRDYIHVSDLADIHLRALETLQSEGPSQIYNCGYGNGFSVRDIVDAMAAVSGKAIPVSIEGRRVGDPASIVANPNKMQSAFSWQPRYAGLHGILKSALDWEAKLEH